MPTVTKTTNDAIISALYLIGELGVGETPDNFMLSTGLEIMNEILDGYSNAGIYIPFLTTITFELIAGQSRYRVSDVVPADIDSNRIIDLAFANYTVDPYTQQPITYPLSIITKATYYDNVVLQKLQTRPQVIFLDKQANESYITVYPVPDRNYLTTIQAKIALTNFSYNQDLTEVPPSMYGFIKYAVARELRSYYPSSNWNETAEDKYQEYLANLKATNEIDVSIRSTTLLNISQPFYWQSIFAY